MGACQSTEAVYTGKESKREAALDADIKESANDKEVRFYSEKLNDIEAQEEKWHEKDRGYSSGASSSDDLARSSTEPVLDRVGLGDLKTTINQDGDLGACVVRMETPFGKPIEEVYKGVHTGEVLGSGISGIARLVTHRSTGVEYAVKILDLGLIKNEEGLERLRDEIFIMCQLDHPNIVRLEEVYESASEIYLVLELCRGGDLFDRLDEQPDYHYTEAQCARLVKQMLSALRYLHSKNIIHRDLKLENFLFSTRDPESVLKMIDFGLSKHFQFGEVLHDAVGTPYTVAPEIILGSYDEKGDVWAIGVITYLLFTGETPFGGACGEDLHQVRENILNGVCKFEPEYLWENVSDLGKDFVKTLLNVDPNDRPTAKDAQRHPWIQTWAKKEGPEEKTLNPKVIDALVSFKELSDMQKLLSEVLSFTLLPEQIEDLRREFEKIDTDGDGEIMFSELKQVLMGSAGSGSLGALSEEEIEDIFQALRVSKDKDDLSIHWHEFIAAGLSQCKVDDRNLRLAFDRLDVAEKGYITLNDIISLMGSNGNNEKEAVTEMWMDCLRDIGSSHQQITFDDFLVLMKGQSDELIRRASSVRQSRFGTVNFASIPEEMPSPEIGKKALRVPRTPYRKQRSRSLGEQETTPWYDMDEIGEPRGWKSTPDRRPSLMRIGRESPSFHDIMLDETKSPLIANRSMYRAHREMRIAVLEASKRFEELEAEREQARQVALAKKPPKELVSPTPSLTMKRTSRAYVPRARQESDQKALDDASHRGGRHRRGRRKTMSDISGMTKAS